MNRRLFTDVVNELKSFDGPQLNRLFSKSLLKSLDKYKEDLEKAELPPRARGQKHSFKPYVAERHPGGAVAWYYNPEKAKETEDFVGTNKASFIAKFPQQHQGVVSDFIDHVSKDPTRHAVPAENLRGKGDVARLRHVKGLMSGDPNFSLEVHDPNSLTLHIKERHGHNPRPSAIKFTKVLPQKTDKIYTKSEGETNATSNTERGIGKSREDFRRSAPQDPERNPWQRPVRLDSGRISDSPGNVRPERDSRGLGGSSGASESLQDHAVKRFSPAGTLKKAHQQSHHNPQSKDAQSPLLKWKDEISGGLADKKTPTSFDSKSLSQGKKVELEHTSDRKIATEIAMDHLTEDSQYYKKLKTVEGKPLKKVRENPAEIADQFGKHMIPTPSGKFDSLSTKKMNNGLYHHILKMKSGTRHFVPIPGVGNVGTESFSAPAYAHKISESPDPFAPSVSTVLGRTTRPDIFTVDTAQTDPNHKGKGYGKLAYMAAANFHTNLQSGDQTSKKASNTYSKIKNDHSDHFDVKLGSYEDFASKHLISSKDKPKFESAFYEAPVKTKMTASERDKYENLSKSESINVSTVAVVDGDKILMGKRQDNGKWTMPGGHVDPGEHPDAAAKRELYEEAMIVGKDLQKLGSQEIICEDGKKRNIHSYVMLGRPKASGMIDPDGEVKQWFWVDFSNGVPSHVKNNLHSPKNVTLKLLGLQDWE